MIIRFLDWKFVRINLLLCMETEFEKYLKDKKIDPEKFKAGELLRYQEFEAHFLQMHPKSFTSQKLYLINKIRRMYPFSN